MLARGTGCERQADTAAEHVASIQTVFLRLRGVEQHVNSTPPSSPSDSGNEDAVASNDISKEALEAFLDVV